MAEAATVGTANARFFCHECNREVALNLPDFTCSQCQGGFIEQLAQGSDNSAEEEENSIDVDSDPAAQFADLWQRTFFRFPPPEDGDRRRTRPRRPRTRINIRASQRQGERGEAANAATAAAIDVILQNLLGGLGTPVTSRSEPDAGASSGNLVFPFNFLRLHGSPGDYAWGTEGLDTIITQLLNQIDGAGPAPANSEEIANLPRIKASQELVDACTDCAVCQEKLMLGEEVRKLPCNHYFHYDCIAPWLKLHDSCPICRLSLSNTQTRR